MEPFLTAISSVGFPIAMAVFVMVQVSKQMAELTKAITGRDGVLDKIDEIKDALNIGGGKQ
jgi:hypothetical protein